MLFVNCVLKHCIIFLWQFSCIRYQIIIHDKDQLVPSVMSHIDALEILLIVFTVTSLADIEPNISQFCKCFKYVLKFLLSTVQHNHENCV